MKAFNHCKRCGKIIWAYRAVFNLCQECEDWEWIERELNK